MNTRRGALCTMLITLSVGTVWPQLWVHSPMPGVNPSRDYHYSSVDRFGPPFVLAGSDQIAGPSAYDFFPTEGGFLVDHQYGRYRFYTPSGQESGQAAQLWSTTEQVSLPAYSRGIAILASGGTTGVQAVRIEDGQTLWATPGVGEPAWPTVASGDQVFLQRGRHLVTAKLATGETLWDYSSSFWFLRPPFGLSNGLIFFLDHGGTLHAVESSSGNEAWSVANAEAVNLIATPDLVFVSHWNKVTAYETKRGQVQWTREFPGNEIGSMAYAHGSLYATYPPRGSLQYPVSDDRTNKIVALSAADGHSVWEFREDARYQAIPIAAEQPPFWSVIKHLFVADGRIYFLNDSLGRVRVLNAGTGALEWSMNATNVRSMALFNRQLVLLREHQIATYRPIERLYFPEFAVGEGYSVRLTLNNSHGHPVPASIIFTSPSGGEVQFPDSQGVVKRASLVVPPFSSATLLVPDDRQPARAGWVQVESPLPLTGNLIYRYAPGGNVVSEVGVGDARPSDFANVKVSHEDGWSTAVAIAVPGDQEANVAVQLLDTEGNELASNQFTLGSQGQSARFFFELFPPGLNLDALEGTLIIRTDQPLIVTAIRTMDGTPRSSFPVGLKR